MYFMRDLLVFQVLVSFNLSNLLPLYKEVCISFMHHAEIVIFLLFDAFDMLSDLWNIYCLSDGRLMEQPSALSASSRCIKTLSIVIPVHIVKVIWFA